jgi:hypothetical protein
MNTTEIERLLANQPGFQGVFSSDKLPQKPRLLVCNTDPSWKPGEHWIAIYVDKNGRGEYFDSFGRKPDKHFERYLNFNCASWTFTKKRLQSSISSFCGYYCCLYILLKVKGLDMNKLFTNDTGYNDWLVHSIVCQ